MPGHSTPFTTLPPLVLHPQPAHAYKFSSIISPHTAVPKMPTPAFAPQWGKSIKPSGSTPTTDQPPSHVPAPPPPRPAQTPTSATPFPSLAQAQNRSASPSTTTPSTSDPRLSYSRAAHTPQSPSFPEHSYFPPPGEAEHPFRYSKAQILGQWDEAKVQERPIEFMQMAEEGSVLVSKSVVRPAGLREPTELEKKLLATSVNPPSVNRRQPGAQPGVPNESQVGNGVPSRRPIGPPKEMNGANRSIGFAGFGRGEGVNPGLATGKMGAFAGPPGTALADPKSPGAPGVGFAGVGRGIRRKVEGEALSDPTRSAQSNWRLQRAQSGTFEGGVLGFGGSASEPNRLPNTDQVDDAPPIDDPAIVAGNAVADWREKERIERQREKPDVSSPLDSGEPVYGAGGGPGWGSGPKRWRRAVEQKEVAPGYPTTLDVSHNAHEPFDSAAATASQTPVPERDAIINMTPSTSMGNEPFSAGPPAPPQGQEDLGEVQWFYRDPNGDEQGPFPGQTMQQWYTGEFFKDDLPLRRMTDFGFIPLAELKQITGNPVHPFLAPIRPRHPPGIPPQHNGLFPPPGPEQQMQNSFGHLHLNGHPGRAPFGAPTPFEQQSRFGPTFEQPGLFSPNHNPAFGLPHPSPFGRPNEWPPAQTMPGPHRGTGVLGDPHSPFHHPQSHAFSPAIGAPPRDVQSPGGFPLYPGGPVPHTAWGAPGQNPQPEPVQAQWPSAPQPEHHISPDMRDELHVQPLEAIAQSLPETLADSAEPESQEEAEAAIAQGTEAAEDELAAVPEPAAEPDSSLDETEEAAAPIQSKGPPASVWGTPSAAIKIPSADAPSSRKASLLPSLPASAQLPPAPSNTTTQSASKLPPAPASLPPKPIVSPRKSSVSEAANLSPQPTATGGLPAKPAPWATNNGDSEAVKSTTGLSLREIQAAEAKQAEAKKANRAESRPQPQVETAQGDEVLQNMTFGLPQQGQRTTSITTTPVAASPATPVWGGGDAAPKKTLKQIQEEEERRKAKAAQARAAQLGQGTPDGPAPAQTKRGYADLAATATTPQPAVGWTTVGTKSTPAASPVTPSARPATVSRSSTIARASTPSPAPASKPAAPDLGPSPDFLRWTRSALTGLTIPVDEFIGMLLTFPIDPPAADKPGVLEVISDSVYANSSTLDGRRFANEFFTRRKADAQRVRSGGAAPAAGKATGAGVGGGGSLADIVKKEPKKENPLAGFTVVSKQKGKKKN